MLTHFLFVPNCGTWMLELLQLQKVCIITHFLESRIPYGKAPQENRSGN